MTRYLLLLPEAALFLIFFAPVFLRICNPGNIAGMLMSLLLMAITLFWERFCHLLTRIWHHTAGKIGLSLIALLLAVGLVFVTVLSVQMARYQNRIPEQPNTVVVLGCKVRGTKPSLMLRRRLDAAAEYLNREQDVFCIVSGGQGPGEDIAEAQAMKTYLVEKGVESDRILTEDQSTNTEENIAYSKAILEQQGLPLSVTIITDGFHQYRAHLLAEKEGLQAWSVSGTTRTILIPTYWVREWMALFQELVLS